MKITADTNVLVRALVQDDLGKARAVRAGVDAAAGVSPSRARRAAALGGDQLATFDQEAARLLAAAGEPVRLLL